MQTLTVTVPAETPGLFRTRCTALVQGFQSAVSEDLLYDPPAEEGAVTYSGPGTALKDIAERAAERGWSWETGEEPADPIDNPTTVFSDPQVQMVGFVMTLSADNVDRIARKVNEAYAAGHVVTFQGEGVWSQFGAPASPWQNGSLSVNIRGRKARQGVRWAKVGERVDVTWTVYTPTEEEVVPAK